MALQTLRLHTGKEFEVVLGVQELILSTDWLAGEARAINTAMVETLVEARAMNAQARASNAQAVQLIHMRRLMNQSENLHRR